MTDARAAANFNGTRDNLTNRLWLRRNETMTPLQKLLDFIKANPPGDDSWNSLEWKSKLFESLPGWEKIVREQSNWPQIESVRCRGDKTSYEELCEALVDAAGPKLATRWLDSDVPEQAEQARDWVHRTIHESDKLTVELWNGLNEQTKLHLIYSCFDSHPGEPFATWEKMSFALRHLVRERRPLPHEAPLPLMPMIGYVPSPNIMQLRSIVHAAGDHKSLKIIDELIAQRERACNSASQQAQQLLPYCGFRILLPPFSINYCHIAVCGEV